MSVIDTAEIRARHWEADYDPVFVRAYDPPICIECCVPFPCDAIRLCDEVDRLNGVVNEMLTDMSRNTYTAQCKGSATPPIVSVPTQRRSWWMR